MTETPTHRALDLETRIAVLRALQDDPRLSQRELAQRIGVSLGKTNYCLRALIEKGYIKAVNFSNNPSKLGYMYQLTPQGLTAKARITARFLREKLAEHEAIQREIERLRAELDGADLEGGELGDADKASGVGD